MNVPRPTPIFRLMHFLNLEVSLRRGGFYAPNFIPCDGLPYKTIHNIAIQEIRQQKTIPCGPQGKVHDYVAFYFGPRSPMLLQLHTGQVTGYNEGQEPLIYLVTTIEKIVNYDLKFVFSDGHGIALFTKWYDNLEHLDQIDWCMVYEKYWQDRLEDMDRQRRKQAEFLIYRFCPIEVITEIGVLNQKMKQKVEIILKQYAELSIPITIHHEWYY